MIGESHEHPAPLSRTQCDLSHKGRGALKNMTSTDAVKIRAAPSHEKAAIRSPLPLWERSSGSSGEGYLSSKHV